MSSRQPICKNKLLKNESTKTNQKNIFFGFNPILFYLNYCKDRVFSNTFKRFTTFFYNY